MNGRDFIYLPKTPSSSATSPVADAAVAYRRGVGRQPFSFRRPQIIIIIPNAASCVALTHNNPNDNIQYYTVKQKKKKKINTYIRIFLCICTILCRYRA